MCFVKISTILDCVLYAVGKPVFHRSNESEMHGWWMRDPLPRTEKDAEKYYVTLEADPYKLYEYKNKDTYRKGGGPGTL